MTADNEHDQLPERLVAEDVTEAISLRLRRLTSPTLCGRILTRRAKSALDPDTINKKAHEVAWAVRSALGYWQQPTTSLNARILSRYYGLLQISIADQIAAPEATTDLKEVQRQTEFGHGLTTVWDSHKQFPENCQIACIKAGHFYSYCQERGVELSGIAFEKRPRDWAKVSPQDQIRFVSLADLFRRMPELQPFIDECLGCSPLSFHVGHAQDNWNVLGERRKAHTQKTGEFVFVPPPEGPTTITLVAVYPSGEGLTAEYLNTLGLPIANIRSHHDALDRDYFIGDVSHRSDKYWHQSIPLYKSGHSATSVIAPFWNGVIDPFLIHFMALYALSIVVRYLPSLWHEIEDGNLDHIRALIEHYLSIVDNVLPSMAIERITGRRLMVVHPGSLHAPA